MTAMILSVLALVFGVIFGACEVYGTYEYLRIDQDGITYIVIAGSAIAAAVSLLPAWASLAWRGRPLLSLAIWVLFVAALGSVIASAVSRTGSMTDVAQSERMKADDAKALAAKAEADARRDVDSARAALDRARTDVTENAAKKTCASNCAALLEQAVSRAEGEVEDARTRLNRARAVIIAAPAVRTDSLSVRIAAVLPVSEENVRTFQPIVVPLITSALSAVLTALGIWGLGTPWNAAPVPKEAPPKQPSTSAPPAQVAAPTPAQVPERLVPVPPRPAEPPTASLPPPARLTVVPFRATGSQLAKFADRRIRRVAGAETSMRDVLVAYEADCLRQIKAPLDRATFTRELATLCKQAGVNVRVDGRDAYLVGASLVARG